MRLHFEDGERELVCARLQLAEDADDATIAQAMATWVQEDPAPEPTPDPSNPDDPAFDVNAAGDDVVIVDVASFARLRQRDRVAAQVEEQNRVRDRNELVEEAIADGKFGPSRRDHYRTRFDSDPDGTRALIGRLTPNTVPLEAQGEDSGDEVDQTSYPVEWVPEVAARQARAQAPNRSRVHGEE